MEPITGLPPSPPAAPGPFAAGDTLGACVVLEASAETLRWGRGQSASGVMGQRGALLAAGVTPLAASVAAWGAGGAWIGLAVVMGLAGLAIIGAALRPALLEWGASRQTGLKVERLGWLLRREVAEVSWGEVRKFGLFARGLGVEASDGRTHLLLPAGTGDADRAGVERLVAALSAMLAQGTQGAGARRAADPARNRFKERKRAA